MLICFFLCVGANAVVRLNRADTDCWFLAVSSSFVLKSEEKTLKSSELKIQWKYKTKPIFQNAWPHPILVQRCSREAESHTLLFLVSHFHVGEAPREGVVKQVSVSHSADFRKYCSNTIVCNNCVLQRPGCSVVSKTENFLNAYKKW